MGQSVISLSKLIDLRYVMALVTMLLSSMYRKKTRPISLLLACLILYLAYGSRNLVYILSSVSINILMLRTRLFNEYVFAAMNLLILYNYKLFGHRFEPRIQSTFDISGFLMLMVIKSTYLAAEYHRPPTSAPGPPQENGAAQKPTTGAALQYLLFIPGLLSGPTPTFSEFMAVDVNSQNPFPTRQFIKALLLFGMYCSGRTLPFKQIIMSDAVSIWVRLLVLQAYNMVLRAKFHFIWTYADCCFLLHGFHNLHNIDYARVEFCESVGEISAHWNKFVSRWLKTFFFLRLRGRSFRLAVFVTHIMSGILHGLNPCYVLFAMPFGIFRHGVDRMNSIIPSKFLRKIQMMFFVSFFSMPFYLLSLEETYYLWKALYFYGIIYFGGISLFFAFYDTMRRAARKEVKNDQAIK